VNTYLFVECKFAGQVEVLGESLPPIPICPPQIARNLIGDRTRSTALRGQPEQWLNLNLAPEYD
jgi:hypothetical protein